MDCGLINYALFVHSIVDVNTPYEYESQFIHKTFLNSGTLKISNEKGGQLVKIIFEKYLKKNKKN